MAERRTFWSLAFDKSIVAEHCSPCSTRRKMKQTESTGNDNIILRGYLDWNISHWIHRRMGKRESEKRSLRQFCRKFVIEPPFAHTTWVWIRWEILVGFHVCCSYRLEFLLDSTRSHEIVKQQTSKRNMNYRTSIEFDSNLHKQLRSFLRNTKSVESQISILLSMEKLFECPEFRRKVFGECNE